jgi:riboflavin transporter FmnP
MKRLFLAIGIALGVYFIYKLWTVYSAVKSVKDSATEAVVTTASVPFNIIDTQFASVAFLWDIVTGSSIKEAADTYKGTTAEIWK